MEWAGEGLLSDHLHLQYVSVCRFTVLTIA